MELAKKRDETIPITTVAVDKIGRVEIPGFTAALNDELQRHHKELLTIAMNENDSNEVLRIWNIYTGLSIDTFGDAKEVDPNSNPVSLAFSAKSKLFSLGYLHNHPTTSNFSWADLETFLSDNLIVLMTVVTNQGEVYSFCKTDSYDPALSVDLFNSVVMGLGGKGAEVGDEFAKEFAKICKKGGIVYGKK